MSTAFCNHGILYKTPVNALFLLCSIMLIENEEKKKQFLSVWRVEFN